VFEALLIIVSCHEKIQVLKNIYSLHLIAHLLRHQNFKSPRPWHSSKLGTNTCCQMARNLQKNPHQRRFDLPSKKLKPHSIV
jgi:hypothetical protein